MVSLTLYFVLMVLMIYISRLKSTTFVNRMVGFCQLSIKECTMQLRGYYHKARIYYDAFNFANLVISNGLAKLILASIFRFPICSCCECNIQILQILLLSAGSRNLPIFFATINSCNI